MSGDILYLQTADGNRLFVPDDDVKFLVYGNFGAPPTNFITRKGYRQNGVTEVDYLLDPRTISVELWHAPACTRQVYWDNRLALHEFLRPNRNGPLQFVLREPGGNLRALTVRANPGLQFPMPGTDTNNWNIDEAIDFIADDPIWFNPAVHSSLIVSSIDTNLVFPITFPIVFGSSGYVSTLPITYQGTWKSYPKLTVFGPYSSVAISNITTGITIYLTVAIAAGERRIIDLTPGAQSIVDGLGLNKFSDLGIDSNLVDFNIRPDGEVPGGIQTIEASFTGGALGVSGLQVDFYDRYFAL